MAAIASSAASLSPRCLANFVKRFVKRTSSLGLLTTRPIASFAGLRAVQQSHAVPVRNPSAKVSERRTLTTATIAVGDTLPDADLSYFDKEGNLVTVSTSQLTKAKKVVLFAVPGAFTPTCSQKHLPGFVEAADALKSKGVDTIACVSVNDPFVMRAWGVAQGTGDKVLLLADGSSVFTKALGVELDLTDKGLGMRSRRYVLLAEDGVVKSLHLEEGGAFTVSGPDEILKAL